MKRLSLVLGSLATLLLLYAYASLYAPVASAQQGQGAPAQGQGAGRGGQGGPGGAGGRGAPQPTQNLQVLPKEYTVQQVIPIMQASAAALGVTCEHCHKFLGPGNPMNDMASDEKPEKDKARLMMKMVQTVNTTIGKEIGKPAAEVTQVACVTCHRGVPIPKQIVDIVTDLGNQTTAAAGVAKYRELRKQFYGAQAYDFSDASLFTAAQRATAANKPDDAVVYANANLEFNPNSARSYQAMSQAYTRKMDNAKAIEMMEKAVAMDPMNMQFQNQLNQLKNPGGGRGGAGGAPPARGQ